MRKYLLLSAMVFALMIPALSFSQSVAQVTTVEVSAAKTADYVAAVKQLIPVIKKHNPKATVRIWQATIAGAASARISVVVEFESLSAWATGTPKFVADPDYSRALRGFEGLGRKILSVTLATEL